MIQINPIKDLNDICLHEKSGIYKKWVLKTKSDFHKLCSYLQQINFSIQDLNAEIDELQNLQRKSIVYAIILVVWIKEAFDKIIRLYREDVISNFTYLNDSEISKVDKYISALRSFVVAHPLSTDRHKDFGFDGNYICVDMRTPEQNKRFGFAKKNNTYRLDYNGLHENEEEPSDFYLYVYSNESDGMHFSKYIGCKILDIYHVAELYIDKLYVLNRYLSKQKKEQYQEATNDQT